MQLLDSVGQFFLRLLNPDRYRAQEIMATLTESQRMAVGRLMSASERYRFFVSGHSSVYLIQNVDILKNQTVCVFDTACTAYDSGAPIEIIRYHTPSELRDSVVEFLKARPRLSA